MFSTSRRRTLKLQRHYSLTKGTKSARFSILSFSLQARQDRVGSWPWCGPWEGGLAEARFRYSLTTLTVPRRCLGMARRRVGRGGRSVNFLFVTLGFFPSYLLLLLINAKDLTLSLSLSQGVAGQGVHRL